MKISDAMYSFQKACIYFGHAQGRGLKAGDVEYEDWYKLVKMAEKQLVDTIAKRIEQERPSTLSLDEMDCEPCVKMFRD